MRSLPAAHRRTHAYPLADDRGAASARAMPGAGSILTVPGGAIAGDVRAIGLDRKRRTVTYEVRVVNETPLPLATFAYSADDATTDELTWSSIVVPARSSIALPIELALARRGKVPRLIVQLFTERAHLTFDGEPPASEPRGNARRGGLLAATASLLALGAAAYAAERPRVVALGAPPTVVAGASFDVAYALASARTARYTIARADGTEVGGGTLDGRSGAFAIALPPGVAGGYDIELDAATPLGSARRIAHVAAIVPPSAARAPQRARIASLALSADDVNAGEPFEVRYTTDARAGAIKVIDQDGTVRAEALLAQRGSSLLLAPLVERDQDMRVVLDVARGETHSEASVPVRIRAALPPQPADAKPAADANARPTASAVPGTPEGPLTFPKAAYRSGERMELGVRFDEPALRVTLADASGTPYAASSVAPGAGNVLFIAPRVPSATRVLVVTTYARGVGVETMVHPLTILPALR